MFSPTHSNILALLIACAVHEGVEERLVLSIEGIVALSNWQGWLAIVTQE